MATDTQLKKFLAQQSQYVGDPVKWAYDLLKFDCDKWQREALGDLVSKRFCAWSTGTGVGKSACLSIATLWFLSTRPFPKVPSTAPSQHQLFDVLWGEHAKWLRRSELLSKLFKWTATKIGLRGHEAEWYAVARTSRPKPGEAHAEGLQGFHSGHILFMVDEGSAVDDSIYSAMDGAFTTPDAYGIIASNPTRRSGYFFKQITDPHTTYAVKFVDANACRMVTKESIERVITKYGKESDFYRVKVLGIPPLVDFASLITDEQVYAAHDRELIPDDTEIVVVAIDPARFGDDDSVMFARKGRRILERLSVHGMDTVAVAKLGLEMIQTHKASLCLVDVIGIGAGVADRMREGLKERKGIIVDINVSKSAVDEAQFFNIRAEMYWNLRSVLNELSLPFATPLLDEELVAIKYSAEKKIQMEKKEELKRAIGRSPNDADALALLFYNEVMSGFNHISPTYFKVGATPDSLGIKTDVDFVEATWAPVGARRYSEFKSNRMQTFR